MKDAFQVPGGDPAAKVNTVEARRWRFWAGVVGLSGPFVGALAMAGAPLYTCIAVHVVASVIAQWLWRAPGESGRILAMQARTLVLCFPIVGSVAAWLIYGRVGERSAKLLEDYKSYIGYERERPRHVSRVSNPDTHLEQELSILPLRDQLVAGDLAAKHGAASQLLEFEGGDRVLREALLHPEDETRLFASLALVRQREAMFTRLRTARSMAAVDPGDPLALLELARAAQAYAVRNEVGERVAASFWEEAATAARAALGVAADREIHAEAHMVIAGERGASSDYPSALAAIEVALRLCPEHVEAGFLYCELLFKTGSYKALAAAARQLQMIAPPGSEAHEVASFWMGVPHAS